MNFARAACGDVPNRALLGWAGAWMLLEQDLPALRVQSHVGNIVVNRAEVLCSCPESATLGKDP